MSIHERKQRHLDERRENILTTAKNIARQEGWQAVSIRRIADEIEYSSPVIYSHFECKKAILFEIRKEGFEQMNQQMKEALETTKTLEDGLIAISKAHYLFAFDHPELYQVMFGLEGTVCPKKEESINGEGKKLIEKLFEQLKTDENTETQELIDLWWSFLTGFIALRLHTAPDECSLIQLEASIKRLLKSF